jgi:hypothetical protein
VTNKFKYLGSYLSRNDKDDYDVNSRIYSAGNAFGALQRCIFFSYNISTMAKRSIYISIVLSILLYDSECWSLIEKLLDTLRVFQSECIRSMCRVTKKNILGNTEFMRLNCVNVLVFILLINTFSPSTLLVRYRFPHEFW